MMSPGLTDVSAPDPAFDVRCRCGTVYAFPHLLVIGQIRKKGTSGMIDYQLVHGTCTNCHLKQIFKTERLGETGSITGLWTDLTAGEIHPFAAGDPVNDADILGVQWDLWKDQLMAKILLEE